jgi:hypothetical protein
MPSCIAPFTAFDLHCPCWAPQRRQSPETVKTSAPTKPRVSCSVSLVFDDEEPPHRHVCVRHSSGSTRELGNTPAYKHEAGPTHGCSRRGLRVALRPRR